MDRKSTSGFAVYLSCNSVSWVCRKQRTVAQFFTKTEYKGLADVIAEVTWVMSLLTELVLVVTTPPSLWCDNLGATYLCANPMFHARTKRVDVNYHFVRDKVASSDPRVRFVSTQDQVANIFTKLLSVKRFEMLRGKLNVVSLPP